MNIVRSILKFFRVIEKDVEDFLSPLANMRDNLFAHATKKMDEAEAHRMAASKSTAKAVSATDAAAKAAAAATKIDGLIS